ncbi:uncharacterized protein N7484_009274 [Penicillium longicatenatum]|uniref:uncharacterized protein n=1 Tax=Penicillium longicatenatum TaxID=1561947 RepID=UPI0025481221|nr:uncharacterized protein N7484_009274 [Penicillium longicatenatum]KAJ5635961.1 hypothetical protein N7484_009274 [Penicillium longicatenatum]KAJ5656150.1 hypothetical protein N7507_008100 [Penicillium longicatenatum]
MQFKNILVASCLALGASAAATNATDIAPSVQNRFAQIDLGYQQTYLLLNHLDDGTNNTSADDVVSAYNTTANGEAKALGKNQPIKPLTESTQLVICQAFHSLALTGIQLNNAFVDSASHFNKAQRNDLQVALTKVNDETGSFFINVAKPALPYCLTTLQTDQSAIYKSILAASTALDPSEALL